MTSVEPLRERLVTAGVAMLEEIGAGELGLRAIAREAGVSHGAPRRYFPTHNSLLAAIAARGYLDLRAKIEAAQGDTAEARVRNTCLAYIDFATARPEMFTLMFRHDLLEGAGENLRVNTTLPMFARWRELVAECVSDGAGERALSLWTQLHGIAVVVANRSIEAVAPGTDIEALVARAVARHLAPDPS
ncbi:TetR/AcrR family transcriptional regulator [Nocardia aurantiaca]|uniref:TetR family transcriptional regulator n=1 Tax=Nocardia aurantiaca TaxID=2675850 RepID=A0A6I3KXA9_9NOCA|nr:TetR/AcrR family transcriptional regulator [Nocardia aurantiaca]MTE15453.1 TetR family transcriptional regulator [Nocardia aurantiaca]